MGHGTAILCIVHCTVFVIFHIAVTNSESTSKFVLLFRSEVFNPNPYLGNIDGPQSAQKQSQHSIAVLVFGLVSTAVLLIKVLTGSTSSNCPC